MTQSRPMPPLASAVPTHELTMGDFAREFDGYFDGQRPSWYPSDWIDAMIGSTTINDEDLTEDQRALAETLTGMRELDASANACC